MRRSSAPFPRKVLFSGTYLHDQCGKLYLGYEKIIYNCFWLLMVALLNSTKNIIAFHALLFMMAFG